MHRTLSPEFTRSLDARLVRANAEYVARYPGESAARQPCQTTYVGAHEYHASLAREHGETALRALETHAPDAPSLAAVLGIEPTSELARTVYSRVVAKLRREPTEDLRVDFEDGYGNRADAEEDAHALSVARAIAQSARENTLPPFIGIRTKPLNEDLRVRSMRTTDLFVTALVEATQSRLPAGLILTLAKVTVPEQVSAFTELLAELERGLSLAPNTLRFEIMIEVAQAVLGPRGEAHVPLLVEAGRGRCVAAHLGTYDFTASLGITAAHQGMAHSACDFAKHVMQVSLAGRGVFVSDGSTNLLPVAPAGASETESRDAIRAAWRLHASDVRRSLVQGFYQGWDLHPAQLPTRYGALYAFFLEALPRATARLANFVTAATKGGNADAGVQDDAATGQALLNFFLRGMSCGAITDDEALRTGLTLDEIRSRSFAKILASRKR